MHLNSVATLSFAIAFVFDCVLSLDFVGGSEDEGEEGEEKGGGKTHGCEGFEG